MTDFPYIVETWGNRTTIAVGPGMPSERSDGAEFRPICIAVVEVPASRAQEALQRIRERLQGR